METPQPITLTPVNGDFDKDICWKLVLDNPSLAVEDLMVLALRTGREQALDEVLGMFRLPAGGKVARV